MLLENKTIVMTGAASGIGRATAHMLMAEGARVLICDINEKGAKETLQTAKGGSGDFIPLDLTSLASAEACGKEAIKRTGGRIDVLVNAAGWDQGIPFKDNTHEFMDKVLALNLAGPIRLTHGIYKAMIEAGKGGKIVSVASDAGRVGSSGEVVYSAAKGGIIALTKALAREGARYKITANCVCPGPTDTPLFHANPEKLKAALIGAIPMKRLAKPEDIGGAILYFCGPASDYVTGQVLSVSGGLTMHG
jgi:2-hydroxycyclohexanecarboxyl-CoA dehydrogenase